MRALLTLLTLLAALAMVTTTPWGGDGVLAPDAWTGPGTGANPGSWADRSDLVGTRRQAVPWSGTVEHELGAATSDATTTEGKPQDHEALRDQIRAIVDDIVTTGVSVGMVEDGTVAWVEGFGTLEPEGDRPTTADTLYRVGSFSKTFIALAVAGLVEEGALSLNDRVDALAPEVEMHNPWAETDPVRVTHLLEHTAGFDEMRFNELAAYEGQLHWSPRKVLEVNPGSRTVRWRPGTRQSYSNPGYTVAAHLVETVSGRSWEAVVHERILRPVGMDGATFQYGPQVAARLAPAYRWRKRSLEPMPFVHLLHRPGGGLYASARDMTRFVATLVADGRLEGKQVIPAAWIERIEQGGTLPYPGLKPEYGLGLLSTESDGTVAYGHGGWMPGHFSVYRYFPSVGAGLVVLTNEAENAVVCQRIVRLLQAYLLRRAPRERPAPVIDLPPEVLDRHVGTYRRNEPDVAIAAAFGARPLCRVRREGGRLRWSGARECRDRELVPTGEQTFRSPNETRASFWLGQSPEGNDMVWDARTLSYYERVPSWWGTARALAQVVGGFGIGGGILWPVAWLPVWIVHRRRPAAPLLRVMPCLGAWSMVVFVHLVTTTPSYELGTMGGRSLLVFVASWVVPVCGLVGLPLSIWRILRPGPDPDGRELAAGIYGFVISLGLVAAAVHLAMHGILGLRTWSW